MSKVFVITEGCYSDYSILAVYSTKELAEKYLDKFGDKGDHWSDGYSPRIEEHELDVVAPLELTPYTVSFDFDGEVKEAKVLQLWGAPSIGEPYPQWVIYKRPNREQREAGVKFPYTTVTTFEDTLKRALKVSTEVWRRLKADGALDKAREEMLNNV